MLPVLSSSAPLPVVPFADDSEYHALNCRWFCIRRRIPKLTPSYRLRPLLMSIVKLAGLNVPYDASSAE